MTNEELYLKKEGLLKFINDSSFYLPAKIGFIIYDNISILLGSIEKIDNARNKIIQHYQEYDPERKEYFIPHDKIDVANQELFDLLKLESKISWQPVYLSWFINANVSLTLGQLNAIGFMIIDDTE